MSWKKTSKSYIAICLPQKRKNHMQIKKIKDIYHRWALNRNNLVFIDEFSY